MVVAATRQAYTLLFSMHRPPIARTTAAGLGPITPHWGLKFSEAVNPREWPFLDWHEFCAS